MTSVDHHDPLIHPAKLENPDMKDNIQMLKLRISILRPYIRFLSEWHIEDQELGVHLKHLDDVVQKVIQEMNPTGTDDPTGTDFQGNEEWESSPTNVQLVISNLNILESLVNDMDEIDDLRAHVSTSCVTSKTAEHVVSFMDSLVQNVMDILICRVNTVVSIKNKIEDIKERLILLRNFLRFVANMLIEEDNVKDVMISVQTLTLRISNLLYVHFLNDKIDDEIVSNMKEDVLSVLVDEINTLQLQLREIYNGFWESLVAVSDDSPTAMDEQVLALADYLIHKIRQLSGNEVPCFIVAAKDLIDILADELSFLRYNLMDLLFQNPIKEMKSLTISTQALILKTGLLICISCDTKEDEQMVKHFSFDVAELLKDVDNLKQQASDLFNKFFSKSWQSNYPCTDVLEYANFLIKKLEELFRSKAAPLNGLKHQIETAFEEIVSMRKLLCAIAEEGNSQMEILLTRYKDAAHQAEDVIDSFVAGEGSIWCHKLGLFVVTKDVKILQKEVKAILTRTMTCDTVIPSLPSGASSQATNPPNTNFTLGSKDEIHNRVEEAANKLVGLKDTEEEIIELLIGGPRRLNILSIVGMPGLGKTTLANSVYKHPSINLHFHVCAWSRVSQVYDKKTFLFEIFGQIAGKTNQSHETGQEDLDQKLYQKLKGRRYLIVLDDIWDIKAWNEVKKTFPDDENGSRILFTTRCQAIALEAKSILYALRLLSQEESCELLWLKLFNGETCPPDLSTVSRFIARKCKGLPLAVVLIAGILKRMERKKECWEHVANTSIRPHLKRGKYMDILEFSYKHLPDCLKRCFLYFGTFPENTTISASKLIQLWICERFVQQPIPGQRSLEQVAENYLNDLVDRSLVMIDRRSSKSGVKACHVHDVIRDFCSLKLQDERLLMQEDKFGGIFVLHGELDMCASSSLYYYRSDRATNVGCRERLYFPDVRNGPFRHRKEGSGDIVFRDKSKEREEKSEGRVFGDKPSKERRVRSGGRVFGDKPSKERKQRSGGRECSPSQPRPLDYDFICQYKLLRVLDLGNVRVESSADTSDLVNIAKLSRLRYLAIRVRTTKIPSEIGNLRNLETFLLSGAIGKVKLPDSFWNLVSLRHIITYHSFFSFQHYSQEFLQNFSQMDNVKSICALPLYHGNDVEKFILRRLTGIQKLGCKFSNSWDDSTGCNLFPVLDFLSKLESLKVFFFSKALYPCKFSFPANLKKLALSNSRLPWEEISVIGRLPSLQVLKLLNKAFKGQQWDMREGEFQKLKFLKLESLDIELWNASSENLPCLEQLAVVSCQQLEEIPSSFGEIPTLQLIEMKWCSRSATDSVKQILEDQHELSNNQLKVILACDLA